MIPISFFLIVVSNLIPFTTCFSTRIQLKTTALFSRKLSRHNIRHVRRSSLIVMSVDKPILSSSESINSVLLGAVQVDEKNTMKDDVILGTDALQRMTENTNHAIPPLSNESQFLLWARGLVTRKYRTDREFRERVMVRELKKLHCKEIQL